MPASQWHQRALVAATCAGLMGTFTSVPVHAQQKYPTKPVRVVISTTAGSQPDMIVRVLAHKLSEIWAQPVVVDNRPGGGGTLAAVPVAQAAPDGYTLLYTLPNFTISAAMQPSLPYAPLKDFDAISQIGMSTNVLVASPALRVKSLDELVALAKAQPGKLVHASSAVGSASHLTGARTDGTQTDVWTRLTRCLRQIDGRWKITHSHESVPFYMDGSNKAALDLKP